MRFGLRVASERLLGVLAPDAGAQAMWWRQYITLC